MISLCGNGQHAVVAEHYSDHPESQGRVAEASNIRGRVATNPLTRARRYPRTRRRNEWN